MESNKNQSDAKSVDWNEIKSEAPSVPAGKVLVDEKQLGTVLERLDALEKGKLEDAEKIRMLETVADAGRVAAFESGKPKKLVRIARLNTFDGKLIVGWRTVKDEVLYIDNKVVANQVIKLFLLDDKDEKSEIDQDYLTFVRKSKSVEGEIIKKADDEENGTTIYTLRLANGRQVEVDVRFINAF